MCFIKVAQKDNKAKKRGFYDPPHPKKVTGNVGALDIPQLIWAAGQG
jgi:hypothetical protein